MCPEWKRCRWLLQFTYGCRACSVCFAMAYAAMVCTSSPTKLEPKAPQIIPLAHALPPDHPLLKIYAALYHLRLGGVEELEHEEEWNRQVASLHELGPACFCGMNHWCFSLTPLIFCQSSNLTWVGLNIPKVEMNWKWFREMAPEHQEFFLDHLPGGQVAAEYVQAWSSSGGFYEIIAVEEWSWRPIKCMAIWFVSFSSLGSLAHALQNIFFAPCAPTVEQLYMPCINVCMVNLFVFESSRFMFLVCGSLAAGPLGIQARNPAGCLQEVCCPWQSFGLGSPGAALPYVCNFTHVRVLSVRFFAGNNQALEGVEGQGVSVSATHTNGCLCYKIWKATLKFIRCVLFKGIDPELARIWEKEETFLAWVVIVW